MTDKPGWNKYHEAMLAWFFIYMCLCSGFALLESNKILRLVPILFWFAGWAFGEVKTKATLLREKGIEI